MAEYPTIDANPTKRFFISMLVRDIQLLDAIVDLVDNSVDAARSLRRNRGGDDSRRYEGLVIELTLTEDRFEIFDNCGGIPATHAQKYVFNFGRKDDFPAVEGSVGQFGVGMKRALFKLGRRFRIESRAARSSFLVDEDVDEWALGDEVPWVFTFEDYHPRLKVEVPEAERFTRVSVERLYPEVAAQFRLGSVQNELARTMGDQHHASLDRGLEILVNGHNVARRRPLVLMSPDVQPAHRKFSIEVEPGKPLVEAEIIAGLSDTGEQAQAGWYLYCNDRLVVNADKTALTGWGRAGGGALPAYHPEYRRFRGFAFLSCDDAGLLPWNTTKTSVDPNSKVYRELLVNMLPVMQQVIAVIKEADDEMEVHPRGAGPLNKAIREARAVGLAQVPIRDRFEVKVKRAKKARAQTTSVQYRVDVDRLEEVKESLGVTSAGQAGLATFDYYYRAEVE